ncbi:unnamed protein product [Sphagnum troendelagicum]|uniref:Anaphase-promoting complex subunit 2 n=1 Tax=Sphagnum troendelagicum TaxID=128251 RepID=A0ABP0V2D6_9BRYO
MAKRGSMLAAVAQAWHAYALQATTAINSSVIVSSSSGSEKHGSGLESMEFATSVRVLCDQGLAHLVLSYFLDALERTFKQQQVSRLWQQLDPYFLNDWVQATLPKVLAEVSEAKLAQETLLATLAGIIHRGGNGVACDAEGLLSRYHTALTALLLTSAPHHFSEVLNLYFKGQLDEFSKVVKQRNHSPQGSYVTDENADGSNASPDYSSGEDDEMDVALSSHHTSVYADEMDVNGSSHGSRRAMNLNDSDGVRDMELTDYVTNSELKLSVGAASIYEVVTVAGEDWVAGVGSVVNHLRHLGFAAMSEEGYASAIYSLLKVKIHGIANKRYERPVLGPIRRWIEAVPLRFLSVMLAASGTPSHFTKTSPSAFPSPLTSTPVLASGADKTVTERVIRWRLRLQFFAYETLGDLRISELFDVIVDYPESIAAIEDLRQCLANTGHHAKLVESFRTALRQRLLTAGAATTDILLQYVSTIKALRTMDPTGVVLEAVAEPIKEYLRGRKDTIRCIVTMLTDDTGVSGSSGLGGAGESLFEELSRGVTALENADSDDDGDGDGDEAWAAAERWEPDPVEADPSRTSKSRRLMDIISMLVGIYGSKELFVNEYRVMLAEKLLNKSDYDTDRDIRTLELLKLRFGESNMHGCEIMLKDVADSKRINSNIKASAAAAGLNQRDQQLPLEVLDATIISSLFWPPFQAETLKVPAVVEQLLDDYAQRYHALKAPRKLQWRKHLGTVKLELQFEDRSAQFVVSPMHAAIIMQFEAQPRWTAAELAEAVGVPILTLRRRIMLWVNQGVLRESHTISDGEIVYTIVETMGDAGGRTSGGTMAANDAAVPLLSEEDGESAVASMEDQWQQEMSVYESYVVGMLTNFDSLPLDRIHNMLKMFVSDPPYDKTLQQLQGFLGRLISEEKLEVRDGLYRRRQL